MTIQTPTLSQACKDLRELKELEAGAKAEYEDIKRRRERFESDLMDRMEAEESEGHKTDGSNFVPAKTVYGQVQDRSEFVKWAEDNDPELLETKERKALINQLAREKIDNGEPLPPGLGHYEQRYISIRAA